MPITDHVLLGEISAHLKEAQGGGRLRDYERHLQATRDYIRAPENREKVRDATRALLVASIRSRPDSWGRDELDMLMARDGQLRAYLEGPQTRDLGPAALHVNQLMTNLSVRYTNPDYIGELVAPPIPVDKESNIFAYYDERDSLAFPDNDIGANGEVPEIDQGINTADHNYQCLAHGFKQFVTPRSIANADVPLDPLLDAQLLVMEGNGWRREKKSATFYTSSDNYASGNVTNISAGEEWDSAGGGDPAKVLMDMVKGIFRTRGTRKVMGMSIDVFAVLSRHPAILDVSKYTNTGFLTVDQLRAYFLVDAIYVSEAWEDTANKGQDFDPTRLWGDYVFVVAQQPAGGGSIRSYQHSSRFRRGAVQNETLFVPHEAMQGRYHVKETYLESLTSVAPRAGALATNCLVA